MRHLALVSIIVLGLSACGGDNKSPTSPTPIPPPQPVIPNVAGTYRGPLSISGSIEGSMVSASGTLSMTVAQAGAQLTISVSFETFGETEDIGTISAPIDAAGRVTIPVDSLQDPDCGAIMDQVVTLTFTGNMAAFRVAATTSDRGTFELSATVTRQ